MNMLQRITENMCLRVVYKLSNPLCYLSTLACHVQHLSDI